MGNDLAALPRAVVATACDAARDFLCVHLRDRGFAVENAHRLEYLRTVLEGTSLLVADVAFLREAALAASERPPEVVALSPSPCPVEEREAAGLGAGAYFGTPFADAQALAGTLDAARARLQARVARALRDERELALAR